MDNKTDTGIEKQNKKPKKARLTIFEMVLFAMLGTLMFSSKMLMEFLPNIHLLGMFIVTFTVVFRFKALVPIYIYVFLNGIVAGFAPWWIPYLYVWTVLWGMTMLLPRNMPPKVAMIVYPLVCALHGILFGILYAPAQAMMFSLSFKQMLVWIASGAFFDITHCVSNLIAGLLIYPLTLLLRKLCDSVQLKVAK